MIWLSNAKKIWDHRLEMEIYLHINHLMEKTRAIHIQIMMVIVSIWIARVEACSPTSDIILES
jgi:hypothetical protein